MSKLQFHTHELKLFKICRVNNFKITIAVWKNCDRFYGSYKRSGLRKNNLFRT